MKIKGLLFIILLLAAASATAYLLVDRNQPRPRVPEIKSLFSSLPVNEVSAIEIKSANHSVILRKEAEGWVVADRFNYPADYGRIANLLKALKEARIARSIEGTVDTLARLSLKEPVTGGQEQRERYWGRPERSKRNSDRLSGDRG